MNRNAMLNTLRKTSRMIQGEIRALKLEKGEAWEDATPETQEGQWAFEAYREAKKGLKRARRELASVNATIKFIKKNVK